MKKLLCFILLLTTTLTAVYGQIKKGQTEVIFVGTAVKSLNGQTIILYNNNLKQKDSAKVVNGKFLMKVKFIEPTRYFLFNKNEAEKNGEYSPLGILIDRPGTINLKVNEPNLDSSVISGSPENRLYEGFLKLESQARRALTKKLANIYGTDYSKHFEIKDSVFKVILKHYDTLEANHNRRIIEFTRLHPASYAAVYILSADGNISVDTLSMLFNDLKGRYKQTSAGKNVANVIRAGLITGIGRLAPDFEQADTSGKMIKLSSFRGKYVLIDFWASWCEPCREENPNLLKAYQKFHDKGFEVLGVSLDKKEDYDKWLAAIRQDKLEWTQVSDLQFWKNAAAVLYGVNNIPQNFLVGPGGEIVAKGLMEEKLTEKLEELFSSK